MKTNLLKIRLLIFALFLISYSLFAQEYKSSSNSSPSNIIATTHLDTNTTTIVSFDYINNSWDTLFTVNDYNTGWVWLSTYDSYHRKYFYYGINKINDSTSTMSFYSLDLYTQQIDSLYTIDNTPAVDMLYDIYRNSLLVRVSDAILDYNLTTNSLDSLMTIPHSTEIYSSYAHFYNFIQQKYTYRRSSPINSWVSVNLKELLTDSIFPDTMINNLYPPIGITFDYKTELFFGIASEKITKNEYIVSISSHPNYTTIICSSPADYMGQLNQQKACFDSERGLYLLPYYSNSSINRLAIIDVNGSSVITTSFSNLTNNHHLDNMPDPIIKLEDSLLISNWYSNYSWYFNGNVIPQSNSQTFKPKTTGWYNVSTIRPDNSIAFSDSIYVAFANIDDPNEVTVSILVYPNPAKNFFTLEILNQINSIQNIEITLWDIFGRLINQVNSNDYIGKIIIPTEKLNSGVYLVSIRYNDILIRKKVIISR